MAKKSKIAKLAHQQAMVKRYAEKRRQLKAAGDYIALSKLPRNSSPVRLHNRDRYDGRPHAYMRKFGMSRLNFRRLAHAGELPGVRKASW
ncbi:MAG TPA: 30S ribosomal protein S14 [Candidatus Limosilactobacillus merdipullorum]|uniref:Small ribosomal subunit protein uS14 n=1 Tax=Candidatus Limosilactobacillus merdipullorum TaxID=2838653 RepID=A0A9D1QQX6_9LACO|nr:30S ribosomal protein S14 [Candidatus Limosilactobacillus merdipullorum]